MDADWSVELGHDDPALEFPWSSPDGSQAYVDLLQHPETIVYIPEATARPEIAESLLVINQTGLPWITVKCDVWQDDELGQAQLCADESVKSSYIDLIAQNPESRFSFERHEAWARAAARILSSDECDGISCEFIVRRCWYHEAGTTERSSTPGFYVTFYLFGCGRSPDEARAKWVSGLRQATTLLASSAP
jgi:hypothetical protein